MTTDEGVQDATAKLDDALVKLTHVCQGFAGADADEITKKMMESPRIQGLLEGIGLALEDDTVGAKDALELMTEAFQMGVKVGIQAVAAGLVETIKTMAK